MSALNLRTRRRREERAMELATYPPPPSLREERQPWTRHKLALGLILAPLCLMALLIFSELLFRATVHGAFWKEEGFIFFSSGCLFWLFLGWIKMQPRLPYVFAHELTHLITAKLSGGRIHDWHVAEDHGYVETDKTSVWITLSPYLVPLYTLVVFALYGVAGIFVKLHAQHLVPVSHWTLSFQWAWIFYFMAGVTMCFHATFTMEALATEQSDLRHNGEFFSMMIIFLGNLTVLCALFVVASPTVGFHDVWNDAEGMLLWAWKAFAQ
jgi:hypothetical protein